MLTSHPEIFAKADELKAQAQEFVLATVIAVHGAASAKTGSKAIFNNRGLNLLGWVGGGCAESFVARQALESLQLRTPRIVSVDLDDEVFGLMPCGGKMDVYLEPHIPAMAIAFPNLNSPNAVQFLQQLGFHAKVNEELHVEVETWADIFIQTAIALAAALDRPLRPWRDLKGLASPATQINLSHVPVKFTIIGRSRITEELDRLARMLGWEPQIQSPMEFADTLLPHKAWVVVASHHHLDHQIIARALHAQAEYVALVASAKRSNLIVADLTANGLPLSTLARFFAPAGLNLPSETPTQMAFSILCEILFLQRGHAPWT
jgi:xanthine/CO dehydrogenase XdhC/CoxF family maturation factor